MFTVKALGLGTEKANAGLCVVASLQQKDTKQVQPESTFELSLPSLQSPEIIRQRQQLFISESEVEVGVLGSRLPVTYK